MLPNPKTSQAGITFQGKGLDGSSSALHCASQLPVPPRGHCGWMGTPDPKGGPTVLLCHSGLAFLKSPAARGDSRGQLPRPEETVTAGMASTALLTARLCAQSWPTLCDPRGLWPARLLCPWDFPGQHIGVGCHFLLQGLFPTKGSNLHLLPWQVGSLPLSWVIVFSWKECAWSRVAAHYVHR